jgi:hypothetical protein
MPAQGKAGSSLVALRDGKMTGSTAFVNYAARAIAKGSERP